MKRLVFCVLLLSIALPAHAQQTDINRYTTLHRIRLHDRPRLEPHATGFRRRLRRHCETMARSRGGLQCRRRRHYQWRRHDQRDFDGLRTGPRNAVQYGHSIRTFLRALPAPANAVNVSFKSTTYTIAAGPQIYIRHWKKVTFLIRPGLGAIHAAVDLTLDHRNCPRCSRFLQLPAPASHQSDTTYFVGVGGGFDINLSRRVALRVTGDWINAHLYSDILTNRQNYFRFTIGPAWRFGHL